MEVDYMNIRNRLLKLLSSLPLIQVVQDRQALVDFSGFDYLKNKIEWEGNALTFIHGLLNVLVQEGQETLVKFLSNLRQSEFVGLDQQEELTELYKDVAYLSSKQWNQEVIKSTYSAIESDLFNTLTQVHLMLIRNFSQQENLLFESDSREKIALQSTLLRTVLAALDDIALQEPTMIKDIVMF